MAKHHNIFTFGLVVGVVCAYILALRRTQKLGNTFSNIRDHYTVSVDISAGWPPVPNPNIFDRGGRYDSGNWYPYGYGDPWHSVRARTG